MIVGRESEMLQLGNILDNRQHSLIVIASNPGMGRSTLLQELRTLAENRKWRVLPASNESHSTGMISINQDTSESDFLEMISFPPPVNYSEPDSLSHTASISRSATLREREVKSDQRGISVVSIQSSGNDSQSMINGANFSTDREDIPVIQKLSEVDNSNQGYGTLVLIDSYQPSPEFEADFLRHCIPLMRRSAFPLVIVVAGYHGDLINLGRNADVSIKLGPLSKTATTNYFENLNDRLKDKMSREEIEEYASSSSEDPALIGILTSLLQLT